MVQGKVAPPESTCGSAARRLTARFLADGNLGSVTLSANRLQATGWAFVATALSFADLANVLLFVCRHAVIVKDHNYQYLVSW